MIIAIHQPTYLPYLGFFDKLRKCDVFVIYDDAQFTDSYVLHRNKIRIHSGWKWLTIPVYREKIPINQIQIRNDLKFKGLNWNEDHFKEIKDNYKKAEYFSKYESELKEIYEVKYEKLIDINMALINFLIKAFDIKKKIVYSSEFSFISKSTQKLVDIVKALGGDVYLSGPVGRNYLDLSLFGDIKVVFQDFKHPVYKQVYDGFIENMSAIDALFNVGKFPE